MKTLLILVALVAVLGTVDCRATVTPTPLPAAESQGIVRAPADTTAVALPVPQPTTVATRASVPTARPTADGGPGLLPVPVGQADPSPTATPAVLDQSYRSAAYGFAMRYPSGWTRQPSGGDVPFVVSSPEGNAVVAISARDLQSRDGTKPELDEFARAALTFARSNLRDHDSRGLVKAELSDGTPAYELVQAYTSPDGVPFKSKGAITMHGRYGLSVEAGAEATEYDSLLPTLDAILSSFTFQSATSIPTPLAVAPGGLQGKLVWYSTFTEEVAGKVLGKFSRKNDGLDTGASLALEAPKLYARLLAEITAGDPRADVFTSSDPAMLADLQKRGSLALYRSPEQKPLAASYKGRPEGYWAMTTVDPLVIAWDSRFLAERDTPRSYGDLTLSTWRDKLGIGSADSQAQYAQWYGLRSVATSGFWDRLALNRPVLFTTTVEALEKLVVGDLRAGTQVELSASNRYRKRVQYLRTLAPVEGVPAAVTATGILKSARPTRTAEKFIDYVFSAEGQDQVARELLGTYSARADVKPPADLPALSDYKLLIPSDWEDYARRQPEFRQLWARLFESAQ